MATTSVPNKDSTTYIQGVDSINECINTETKLNVFKKISTHVLDHDILSGRQELEQISHSDPRKFELLNNLAKSLLDRYKDQSGQQDLDEAISVRREAVKITAQSHPMLPAALEMLAHALTARGNALGLQDDFNEAIEVRREALNLDMSTQTLKIRILNNLGASLGARFRRGHQECDINEAIVLYKEACYLQSKSNNSISTLTELITLLQNRFMITGDICDIDECIPLFKVLISLQVHPDPQEYLSTFLGFLATSLQAQFKRGRGLDYLEKAIELRNQALQHIPDPHPYRSNCLTSLATALETLFNHSGGLSYIQEVIKLHRQALELRPHPHPDRSISLNKLGNALQAQFDHSGGLSYLEEAIELHRQALQLRPSSHPNHCTSLHNLANSLQSRFKHGGQLHHLEEAVELYKRALQLMPHPHQDRSTSLTNLAGALHAKFRHGGGLNYLEEAIELRRQALQLTPHPHPGRSLSLNNLAAVLQARFEHGGDLTHIEEAIKLHREALKLRSHPHPDHCNSLNNLAAALHAKFNHGGGLGHLEEAIELHRQAHQFRPRSHPEYSNSLSNLAAALQSQFEHGGGLNYLQEAVSMHKQALQLMPHPHPNHCNSLNNLANALFNLFEHGGEFSHLEEATEMYRQVLQLQPDLHPNRSQSINNLAAALHAQFNHIGGLTRLEEAIDLHKQALELRPKPHRDRFMSSSNLASALQAHYRHSGGFNYLEDAISSLESELQLTPKHYSPIDLFRSPAQIPQFRHSDHYLLITLGKLYVYAYDASGRFEDYLNRAMYAFSSVLQFPSLSPFQHFETAILWARNADQQQHSSAMDAYDCSIQFLPQLTSLGHSLSQRQENMVTHKKIKETAHNASRYAIHMQRFDKAIEYLEAARALLWSQILQFRSSFDSLRSVAPELGDRLKEIATELDQASHVGSINTDNHMPGNKQAFRLAKLTAEWQTKLDEVRKIEGFEDYLLPRRLSSLQEAAYTCPIAVLIPHDYGTYCLVLTSTAVYHIAIPSFTTAKLRRMATDIQNAARHASRAQDLQGEVTVDHIEVGDAKAQVFDDKTGGRFKAARKYGKAMPPDDVFRLVLEELWKELVKPVINILNIKKAKDRRTIQWCPTGVFAFLPIHAAGIYSSQRAPDSDECASDYIVSSYTPTISALLSPEHPSPPKEFKMLAVVAANDLFYTTQELENIKARVPFGCLSEFGIHGVPAHVDIIVSRLPTASIVHFACHGVQDRSNPLHSGLLMDDGKLTIAKIMEQPRPGSLAFLCACETAMGDENLPDEAMSVAASLVFSGFRSVIATMWRIMDRHGPAIADTFYEKLFRGPDGNPMSHPNFTKSALALDIAVQKLRLTGVPFNEWVPFIHMGKAS